MTSLWHMLPRIVYTFLQKCIIFINTTYMQTILNEMKNEREYSIRYSVTYITAGHIWLYYTYRYCLYMQKEISGC